MLLLSTLNILANLIILQFASKHITAIFRREFSILDLYEVKEVLNVTFCVFLTESCQCGLHAEMKETHLLV